MQLWVPGGPYGLQPNESESLNKGLEGWYTCWPFGGSGLQWLDLAGKNRHMTHVGGARLGGQIGAPWLPGSIVYAGSTPYSDAGRLLGTYAPVDGTITCWAYHETLFSAGTVDPMYHALSGSNEFLLVKWTDNSIYAGFNSPGQNDRVVVAASSTNWPQRVWTHYALTWVSNGTTTLYVNGVSIGSIGGTTIVNPSANLRFGYHYSAPTYKSGRLSGVRLYNRELAARDVNLLYRLERSAIALALPRRARAIIAGDAGGRTGTGAVPLAALTSAGGGALALAATGSATFAALTSTGTGAVDLAGTGAVTLGAVTTAATGALDLAATGATTLAALTSAATGTVDLAATGAVTLAALTSTGTGTLVSGISGEGAVTLASMTSAGTGALNLAATGAVTLGALTSAGAGAVAISGTSATPLAPLTAAATGTLDLVATGAVTLGAMTSTGTGTLGTSIVGTGAVTLGTLTAAGAGTLNISASGATTFAPMTSTGACTLAIAAVGAATFGALVSTGQGALLISATGAITFAALAGAGAGSAGGLALVDSRTYVVPTAGAVREVTITASGDWVIV